MSPSDDPRELKANQPTNWGFVLVYLVPTMAIAVVPFFLPRGTFTSDLEATILMSCAALLVVSVVAILAVVIRRALGKTEKEKSLELDGEVSKKPLG